MTLSATELRIGNYLYSNKYNSICRIVCFIGLTIVQVSNLTGTEEWEPNIDSLNPIPLTEEWLLKFGLNKDLDIEYLKECRDIEISFYLDFISPYDRIEFKDNQWILRDSEGSEYPAPQFVHRF